MKNGLQNIRLVKGVLLLLGCTGIGTGVGTGLYSYFELRPKLATLSEQMGQSLEMVESTTNLLEKHSPLFSASVTGIQAGTQILRLLPETLISLRGTLIESSELLNASSAATRETKKGAAGLVLPQEELSASAGIMRKTATQLRLMAKMVEQLKDASSGLAVSTSHISAQFAELTSNIAPVTQLLQNTRNHIRNTRQAVDSLSIPMHAALASIVLGGLYIFLGIFSFVLALIYGEVMHLIQAQYSREKVEALQKKAA
jgi:hypothetical protein